MLLRRVAKDLVVTALIEICESLLAADSLEALHAGLLRAAHEMGFELFGSFALRDANPITGQPELIERVHNVSPSFGAFTDASASKRDPVLQFAKTSSLPLVWNQDTYVKAGCADLWESCAPWGLVSGVIIAMHLPGGRHFCLGVDTAKRLNPTDPRRTVERANLSLVAAYAQPASERLLLRAPDGPMASPLSARERECLLWSAAGKTAWETSVIVSIAESTVAKHLDSAIRKLECSTKVHAVAKALQAGWLNARA